MEKKTKPNAEAEISKTQSSGKNQSISDQPKSELETKREVLHKLIDNITEADYVEVNTRLLDLAGGKAQTIHQIFIEKNGNILIAPKDRHSCFHDHDFFDEE